MAPSPSMPAHSTLLPLLSNILSDVTGTKEDSDSFSPRPPEGGPQGPAGVAGGDQHTR
jgi:hypothetical protein